MIQEYIEMKQKDIKPLKEKIWLENECKCPILKKEITLDKMVLDHSHKRKEDKYAPDKGVIREALEFRVNAFAGKIENSFKRYGLEKDIDLPNLLRNIADYLEKGAYVDELGNMYVHPSEVYKEPKLSKKNYNKVRKLYENEEFIPKRKNQKKKPFPEYPKSGKATKLLRELFGKYNINLFN